MNSKLCIFSIIVGLTALSSVRADEKRHRQLADEYLELSGYKKQLAALNAQSAELYAGTNPEFKDHQPAIQRAYGKVFSFEKIKPELVQLLTKNFTENELIELVKIVKTPAGKKLVEKTPEIAKAYVGFFRKLAGEEGETLSKAIQEEIDKDT